MSCGEEVLVPLGFEEGPEAVARLPHGRVIFIERFAVVEHESEVFAVVFLRFITEEEEEGSRPCT